MKKIIYLLIILILSSCEDVIEVDLPEDEPRLIIDALIRVDESAPTINIQVRASVSGSFFEDTTPARLDEISIINLDLPTDNNQNVRFLTETNSGSGVYEVLSNIGFLLEGELLLQLQYEGQFFLASTRYVPTVPIDNLEQGDDILFDDEDIEVEVTFADDASRDDFYVFDFDFNEFLVIEDEFFQGQEFKFSYFYDKNLEAGQEVDISILGADREFFNYMDKLIEQGGPNPGPFGTPAATVRGNLFNVTELDNMDVFDNVDMPNNFALGYFAVVQEFTQSIVIQ
ncbi:MAG: DUF4249 family protein [Bacteroidota bacterium]